MQFSQGRLHLLVVVAIAIALIVLIGAWWFFVGPWFGRGEPPQNTAGPNQAQKELTSVIAQPDNYFGKKVTVQGEIQAVYSEHILTVGSGGGMSLIVVTLDPLNNRQSVNAALPLVDNANARVTGTLQQTTIEQAAKDHDIALTQPAKIDLAGTRPILIADSLQYFDGQTIKDYSE